ncbi:MAG: hypothetical protein K8I04_09320 [Gammaproteobacteria bacterium]|nr:hypothetical protein [Gammaproteobacteria bacterium]
MNSYNNTLATIVALITFSILTGCATMGSDLIRDHTVKIEKVSSARGTIGFVSVIQEGDEVTLRGEVRRRPVGRGPIPGHIDVEVLDPSGTTLEQMNTSYRRHSIKSRYAKFYTKLGKIPPSGSTIRVTHHYANSHESL